MLPIELVMALTVGLVESIKQTIPVPKHWIWLLVLGIGATLNAANAFAFGGDVVAAVRDGIIAAATASGVYGLAKAAIKGGGGDAGDR
ncbi:hypothetical protein SAMN02745885_01669 [Carboxydocella sporoproducens DSM 16521]|uniref:Holin n=2 Tax=Carboxydocella TaxID=178898 RepID=A0A1T4QGJ1_9FIRM|nr:MULTISPECIES: hypothetical protein [Carboxydocella]AVX21582.1 hypothetical protein CFE_2439 [Carboxydocella thermautotrophica]SKA02812.1 hypothetical protein SAMN02745885_01669 [Carboxydocella sporoproducens DSM 16521]